MLDLAFNRISEIRGLDKLTRLKKLFLSANKISKIENLDNLQELDLLELGDNRIRVSKLDWGSHSVELATVHLTTAMSTPPWGKIRTNFESERLITRKQGTIIDLQRNS